MLSIVDIESHCNSIGCSSWIGLSITPFVVRILIDVNVLSLPMNIFSITLIFHFPRFFLSPFIMTTLLLIFTGFCIWLRLYRSLRAAKYSLTHLFQDVCNDLVYSVQPMQIYCTICPPSDWSYIATFQCSFYIFY